MSMRIDTIDLVRVRLPLVEPFRTALGTTRVRDALLVRVQTSDGPVGWGECAAETTPHYASETLDTARLILRDHLAPRAFGRPIESAADSNAFGRDVEGNPMAKAALEAALLDAWLQISGVALAEHLGAVRAEVDAGVALGMDPDLAVLCARVEQCVTAGYRRVKLKIAPGSDVDVVKTVRAHVGDGVMLQVDANGSYSLDDTGVLAALDAFALACIEQPLPRDQLLDHCELARAITTPICLDESITSAAVARDACRSGACSVVNVKAARVGGIAEAVRVHDTASALGVPVWCGGMLETGVGRAVNVALAALPGFTMPGDLSPSSRYFADDLTEPFEMHGGRLAVPTAPGIGVHVRPEVLATATIAREQLRAN